MAGVRENFGTESDLSYARGLFEQLSIVWVYGMYLHFAGIICSHVGIEKEVSEWLG